MPVPADPDLVNHKQDQAGWDGDNDNSRHFFLANLPIMHMLLSVIRVLTALPPDPKEGAGPQKMDGSKVYERGLILCRPPS